MKVRVNSKYNNESKVIQTSLTLLIILKCNIDYKRILLSFKHKNLYKKTTYQSLKLSF